MKHQTPTFPLALPPAPQSIPRPPSAPATSIDYQTDRDHQSALDLISDDPSRREQAHKTALDHAQELIGKIFLQPSPSASIPATKTQPSRQDIPNRLLSLTDRSSPPSPLSSLDRPGSLKTPPRAAPRPSSPFDELSQTPPPSLSSLDRPGANKPSTTSDANQSSLLDTPTVATTTPRPSISSIIAEIVASRSPTPGPTQFQFTLDVASAVHNGKILEAYNFDLASAIQSDGNSPLLFGSEFRDTKILEPLLGIHPLWPRIEDLLLRGSHFCADPLPHAQCLAQVDAALDYGNHKGATKDPDKLYDLLDDDVTHGFNMPLPLSMARRIPGLLISPMNIAKQNTIDENGSIIQKDRLTHDHSMEFSPKSSINSRSRLEDHEPCHFGHALNRLFHIIVELRRKHPTRRILLTKVDWKAAYRRVHLDFNTSVQCCTHLEDLLLCPLRLTFGGAPAGPDFSCLSDTGSDVSNDLVADPTWDHTSLRSPHQAKMPEVPPSPHPPGELPHPAQPLLFDFPEEEDNRLTKFDNFIDDLIAAGVEIGDNIARMAAAGPLAIHALGRPLDDSEPIPRDDNLSLKKFSAEALPEEQKIVLGWLIDAWALTVKLPQDKYLAWSRSIQQIIDDGFVRYPILEELIGRLQHLCRIIRFGAHFMGRLRQLLSSFNGKKYARRHTDKDHLKDLCLWLKFMRKAATGVSLNILVLRVPTHLYRCDACFHGIGGYSHRGRAWRYPIPEELRLRASINLLEFIGSVMGPWIDFIEGNLPPESSIFSQGDNTTAASWLAKTNFSRNQPAHLKVARRLANLLLESETQLESEWIAGEDNPLADSLSRDTHLSVSHHTALLYSTLPEQMPDGFAITPLPDEISSWVGSILQLLPASPEPCPRPTPSKLKCGTAGSRTSAPPTELTTPSSNPSTPASTSSASNPPSSADSPKPFEQANFKHTAVKAWLQQRSKVTLDRWYKPSGMLEGKTPRSTPTANFPLFYLGNMPASRISTPRPDDKRQSAYESSNSSEAPPSPS